jgi:hypothetical protein
MSCEKSDRLLMRMTNALRTGMALMALLVPAGFSHAKSTITITIRLKSNLFISALKFQAKVAKLEAVQPIFYRDLRA